MIKTRFKKTYYLAGAAMTVGMMGITSSAHATATSPGTANGFKDITENIATSTSNLPGLISSIAYLIGVLLAALGIMKLKDHVENPSQTPMKEGAIRLAAGGALFALGAVMGAMMGTIDEAGTTSIKPQALQASTLVTP